VESVVSVSTRDDFHLELRFNTGERRLFDVRPYLDKGVFQRLRDKSLFDQAYVAFDTVCWPDDLDIAPETLYDRSIPMSESDLSRSDRETHHGVTTQGTSGSAP
jgi:hypothetical protein